MYLICGIEIVVVNSDYAAIIAVISLQYLHKHRHLLSRHHPIIKFAYLRRRYLLLQIWIGIEMLKMWVYKRYILCIFVHKICLLQYLLLYHMLGILYCMEKNKSCTSCKYWKTIRCINTRRTNNWDNKRIGCNWDSSACNRKEFNYWIRYWINGSYYSVITRD